MKQGVVLCILFFMISCAFSSRDQQLQISLDDDLQKDIDWLNTQLNNKLSQKDKKFSFWTQQWEEKQGIYESTIHINFLDKKNKNLASRLRKSPIGDINMFVTSFVLYAMVEAQELGTITIDDHEMSLSLQALNEFRDKNTPYGVPQYMFWPQEVQNGTWYARPVNLVKLINIFPDNLPGPVQKVLNKFGLWMIVYAKAFLKIFSIPADNDDSSVNLALLGFLKETDSKHFDFWNSFNFDKVGYYERVLKYAYRPFESNYSKNPPSNEIDARTYNALHEFLEEVNAKAVASNSTPSVILPTTWLINKEEQVKDLVSMPFNVNNVDATVCANVLLGLSFQILTDQMPIDALPELSQLIKNTVDFLVFVVENKIEVRPDITLVYYPSKYDFYWFLARNTHLLKRHNFLPGPLQYAKDRLEHIMKTVGTDQINKRKNIVEGASNEQAFWVEFLGNYAGKERNDDALFNTVMATNALLDTWTTRNKSTITYDEDTPDSAKNLINQGINFIRSKLGKKMNEFNSFFSGSMKSYETSPYLYPANIHTVNGTNIDPQNTPSEDVSYDMYYCMKGFMEKEKYQNESKKKWFGNQVPEKFIGYNEVPFPFWSSKSITEAMAIAALSKKFKLGE